MTDGEALDEARRTIARQEEELDRLRQRVADERVAADLRDALAAARAAGALASPVTHGELLRLIVETAARVIGAKGGSLLLVDDDREELVFEAVVGSEAGELERTRIPLDHGIAGFVAVSGQPLAVSDAASDPRLADDVVQRIGYEPETLLCVPLVLGDGVIGVLELVDKEDGTFSGRDIEALSLFAQQAAIAIRQSRAHQDAAGLVGHLLGSLSDDGRFADRVEGDAAYRRAVEVSELVHEIGRHGEEELEAARDLLRGFADYLRRRPEVEA